MKDFILENSALIGVVGSLAALTAFATHLSLGWVDTYLRFLLLAAALLVWLELHAQWPDDLQLHRGRRPAGKDWRLIGFAYALQLTMLGFVGHVVLLRPEVLVPALALALAAAAWVGLERRRGGRRGRTRRARSWPAIGVVAAFLLSELLLEVLVADHASVFERIGRVLGRT